MLCRVALQDGREHPEITFRTDALLCSINDRLKTLCRGLCSYRDMPGIDLEPLTTEWLDEMVQYQIARADEYPDENDALPE